jgi:branched-chain amino acid transport system permease protein
MNKNSVRNYTVTGLAICGAYLLAPILNNEYWLSVLIVVLIDILLASSLRLIYLLDQISLGHVGFSLLGAYSSALFMLRLGMPFCFALPAAGLLSAMVALALGYPFLKLKGIYFSILTFMTAEIFRLVTFNWRSLTGGMFGLPDVPVPGPLNLPGLGVVVFDDMQNYYFLTLSVVVASLLILYGLERSHLSMKWKAIRDADNLAASVGVNVIGYRVVNFAIASFFAGIAGALFAHYQRGLSVDVTSRFGVLMSLFLVLYMVVGGKNHFWGPVIGTVILELFAEIVRPLSEYRYMLTGALAIITILSLPEGLVGFRRFWTCKKAVTGEHSGT